LLGQNAKIDPGTNLALFEGRVSSVEAGFGPCMAQRKLYRLPLCLSFPNWMS